MGNGARSVARLLRILRGWGSLVLGLVMLVSLPVFSQNALDTTLFGPKQYLRTTSSPLEYADTVTVPASIAKPFALRIVNGDANGANRISSAWIKVNGVQVAGPADFGQRVALIERAVELNPSNTIEVRLASGPDGYLTLTVLGTRILPAPTALSPNPLTITAGAAGNLTATLAPTPTEAGTLSVASANPGIASVPAAVPFAAGQSTVAIPVTGVAPGNTTVTASANGLSATATVQVTPAPPTVTSLAPASLTVTQGGSAALTVTISAAQPADTAVALAAAPPGIVAVPAQVTVPAGATQAAVPVETLAYGQAGITASLNGSSASALVNVVPPPVEVTALEPATFTMTVGATDSFTVRIKVAQTTNTEIALSSSNPAQRHAGHAPRNGLARAQCGRHGGA